MRWCSQIAKYQSKYSKVKSPFLFQKIFIHTPFPIMLKIVKEGGDKRDIGTPSFGLNDFSKKNIWINVLQQLQYSNILKNHTTSKKMHSLYIHAFIVGWSRFLFFFTSTAIPSMYLRSIHGALLSSESAAAACLLLSKCCWSFKIAGEINAQLHFIGIFYRFVHFWVILGRCN